MPVFQILIRAAEEAAKYISSPARMSELLLALDIKLRQVPAIGKFYPDLALMVSVVKCWGRAGFWVPRKMLLIMVGAILYLVKKYYLMPDDIPVTGIADEVAVVGTALKIVQPELDRYKKWRDG